MCSFLMWSFLVLRLAHLSISPLLLLPENCSQGCTRPNHPETWLAWLHLLTRVRPVLFLIFPSGAATSDSPYTSSFLLHVLRNHVLLFVFLAAVRFYFIVLNAPVSGCLCTGAMIPSRYTWVHRDGIGGRRDDDEVL